MVVMKFGGAVLNSIDGFINMLRIIKANESKKILLVISAFSKSTRNLRNAALAAESGDLSNAIVIADDLYREYSNFAKILLGKSLNFEVLIDEYQKSFSNLNDFLKGIAITRELTHRTLDAVMSFGERLSLLTAYYFLNENDVQLAQIDSSKILITDDNYGFAKPYLELCEKNIKETVIPLIDSNNIVITQGFVASNLNGEITTMGIESSNLSAAIYAKYLNADEFIIYSDVSGIRTADPKLYSNTKCVKQLSYDQAYLIGINGVKLIFADMIEIIRSADMKIIIKSAFTDDDEFTEISSENENSNEIITIEKESLTIIRENFTSERQAVLSIDTFARGMIPAEEYFSVSKNECIAISNLNNFYFNANENTSIVNQVKLLIFINLSGNNDTTYQDIISQSLNNKTVELMITQPYMCKIFYTE